MSQQLVFDLNVDNSAALSSINTFFDAFEHGVKDASAALDKQFGEKNKVIGLKLEGGKVVAKEMNNMATIGNRLEKSVKVMNEQYGKTPKEIRNSIGILKELLSTTTKYKEGTKKMTDEWKTLVTKLREARNIANDMEINDDMERSITGANIAAGLALDAIRALGRGVMGFIREGVEMEVLMIQLKGFTGGVKQAEAAFSNFVEIAKATPFDVKQVAEGARTMMGFGISSTDAAKRVEQLAIVAASTGGNLREMARNLGQIQANQRAYTRDLMQFANQGIPIYQMLGEVMGRTTQQVREMAEEGEVGFTEVAAALDLMTQKGSDYERIAAEMSSTFQSRLEEIASAVTTTAGRFISMIQAMDKALGGPIETSMQTIAKLIEGVGKGFKLVENNAKTLAPIVASLAAMIIGSFGIAFIQNLSAIGNALVALKLKILAIDGVQKALNISQAVYVALTNNFAALALAAGIAAGGIYAYSRSQDEAKEGTKELTSAMGEQETKALANADAEKLLAFQYDQVSLAIQRKIDAQKQEFKDAQEQYNLAKTRMERAVKFLKMEADEDSKNHQDKMDNLKEEIETEKQGQKDTLQGAKDAHQERMTGLKDELQAVRDKYDAELDLLDKESKFAKELRGIRIQEIQKKLKSTDLTRKEKLELQEQLFQINNQIKRREILKRKKAEEKGIQDKIVQLEADHGTQIEKIEKKYQARIKTLESAYDREEQSVKDINSRYEEQAAKVAQFKDEELRAIFENRDAAIASLDAQIAKAEIFRGKMQSAYDTAKNIDRTKSGSAGGGSKGAFGNNFYAGGQISGGTVATVNELGKEAFLSASGKLSMINAPAWGQWKAPSSGTVIPAHLTKQLDIPSGGVNLNAAAGMNAGKSVGMNGIMAAVRASSGGDTFNQSVTVQAANPVQAANNMMVEMAGLKRRRLGR